MSDFPRFKAMFNVSFTSKVQRFLEAATAQEVPCTDSKSC